MEHMDLRLLPYCLASFARGKIAETDRHTLCKLERKANQDGLDLRGRGGRICGTHVQG